MPLAERDLQRGHRPAGEHIDHLRHLARFVIKDLAQMPAQHDHGLGRFHVPMDRQRRPPAPAHSAFAASRPRANSANRNSSAAAGSIEPGRSGNPKAKNQFSKSRMARSVVIKMLEISPIRHFSTPMGQG